MPKFKIIVTLSGHCRERIKQQCGQCLFQVEWVDGCLFYFKFFVGRLFVTPGAIQSLEFSRPEYWSGKPFSSPRDLPQPRDQTQVSHITS